MKILGSNSFSKGSCKHKLITLARDAFTPSLPISIPYKVVSGMFVIVDNSRTDRPFNSLAVRNAVVPEPLVYDFAKSSPPYIHFIRVSP